MASVEKRVSADGKKITWRGIFRVDGRKKHTSAFTRQRDALAEASRLEAAGKRSEYIDPSASSVTLNEFFASRQASRADRAPTTLGTESERYRSLIEPRFGSKPLKHITSEDVTEWSATMPSPRTGTVASAARRRDAMRLLTSILDDAVDADRLSRNPARSKSGRSTNLPRAPKNKPHRYLSHEQLQRIVDCMDYEAGTLVLFAGLTGLRWGEVSALRVGDVDTLRKTVKVERAYSSLSDGTLHLGPTKTHAVRTVPLPAS